MEMAKPQKPIVVYDGECRFCLKQVDRIQRRDRQSIFDYSPRQEEGLVERFPKLAEVDFDSGMRLIERDGTIHAEADAVYEIARRLPLWRGMAWLYRIPGLNWIFRRIYAWIAKNRYRLASKCEVDGECQVDSDVTKS